MLYPVCISSSDDKRVVYKQRAAQLQSSSIGRDLIVHIAWYYLEAVRHDHQHNVSNYRLNVIQLRSGQSSIYALEKGFNRLTRFGIKTAADVPKKNLCDTSRRRRGAQQRHAQQSHGRGVQQRYANVRARVHTHTRTHTGALLNYTRICSTACYNSPPSRKRVKTKAQLKIFT